MLVNIWIFDLQYIEKSQELMESGRLGVTGALVAKLAEEELDQEVEAATLHHHRDPVESALALQPKQVNVTKMLVV